MNDSFEFDDVPRDDPFWPAEWEGDGDETDRDESDRNEAVWNELSGLRSDATDDGLSVIEHVLRDAGRLIDVSDDLRSRTLDQARLVAHDQRIRRRLLLAVLVWIPLSLGLQHVGRQSAGGPVVIGGIVTSRDVFSLADAKATEERTDLSWALVDVFQEMWQRRTERVSDPQQ